MLAALGVCHCQHVERVVVVGILVPNESEVRNRFVVLAAVDRNRRGKESLFNGLRGGLFADRLATLRREAGEQLRARPVRVAEEAPARSVAVACDPALTVGLGAARGAVGDRIDEQNGVARLEMTFDRARHAVDRDVLAPHLEWHRLRVLDVGLVAARHDHRPAVARSDVRQRDQDDDLATMELAGVVAILRADRSNVAAGMHPLRATLAPDRAEALVDEQEAVVGVEVLRIVRSHEMGDLVEPGRMVDQLLPDGTGLVELFEDHPFLAARVVHADTPEPALSLDVGGRDRVVRFVHRGHVVGADRSLEDEIAVQVEQVFLHRRQCRHGIGDVEAFGHSLGHVLDGHSHVPPSNRASRRQGAVNGARKVEPEAPITVRAKALEQ